LQLLGLRWRKYDELLKQHQAVLLECEMRYRELVSEENALIASETQAREKRESLQKTLNERQGRFYEVGAEISRLDQAIKHAHQTRDGLQRERERLKAEQAQAQTQLTNDREQIDDVREELLNLQTEIKQAELAEAQAASERLEADIALKAWRVEWEAFRGELAGFKSQAEVERARIRQMEDQSRQLQIRSERLGKERNEIEESLRDSELESLQEMLALAENDQQELLSRLETLQNIVREQRNLAKSCQEDLNKKRAQLHTSQGKISSLELLQQHAMGKDRAALKQWLSDASLHDASRLAEHLEVSPGWESAVENVLGLHLEAVCVEDTTHYLPMLNGGKHPESMAFFEKRRSGITSGEIDGERLLDCIQSSWNLNPLLGGIYRAGTLEEGKELCRKLEEHESVVTPDGAWMGPGWLVMKKPDDAKAGVLKRERELRELKAHRDELHAIVGKLEQDLNLAEESARQAELEREQRQSEANRMAADMTRLKSQISALSARFEQATKRLRQLEAELEDLAENLQNNAEETAEAHAQLHHAEQKVAELEQRTQTLSFHQQDLEQRSTASEAALRQARDLVQGLKSRCETLKSTEALTLKHVERAEAQNRHTSERLAELAMRMEEAGAPMDDELEALEELHEQRTIVERELADIRQKSTEAEAELQSLNEAKMRKERDLDALKKRLEKTKLDYQENEVRRLTVQEQFDEIGANPEHVIPGIPEDAEEKEWQLRVTQLADEINRLGAINLTAMQEYNEQSERLQTLDAQRKDLEDAQATLTQAIEKIDRECRARFKDTFDRINIGIQRMFPKLFGGGQAYLEMIERDLLETGVTIMARPPGKRNSSIHLLSGGEKALTAVALVFSIFELNPAPFCLLDEVDAPLDDANVGRFSQLVKEMAEKVQFLFISHNKATMEIAQHLAGVTMKEPGVSRIVAVDIDEAVELAAL
jgi:chromosome segregation protein